MRLSELFTKTRKSVPADETARNAKLLIKAGYIHKEMAGIYTYLPLGFMVVEKIKAIIREELNSLGSQEITMASLQSKGLWEKTDRWDDNRVDIWFKTQLKNGSDVGLAWSHEEPITDMMKDFIHSYRDLPVMVYQFQTKFRNETRAKSGIMRTREFVMKDLYSYSKDENEHQAFYDKVSAAYLRIFEKVGLGNSTFLTFASGEPFTQFSHEFQTITEAGEDTIYLNRKKNIAINEEVYTDDVLTLLKVKREELEKVKSAEVGNIFSFGDAKSKKLGLLYTDDQGSTRPVVLGSYGIGVGRLMGVIVEHFADEKGLVWPESVAPARVILVRLGDDPTVTKTTDKFYKDLTEKGIAVLYDDRDLRAGEKFADADLLGIPYRVVVSQQTAAKQQVEIKKRTQAESKHIGQEDLISMVGNKGNEI